MHHWSVRVGVVNVNEIIDNAYHKWNNKKIKEERESGKGWHWTVGAVFIFS